MTLDGGANLRLCRPAPELDNFLELVNHQANRASLGLRLGQILQSVEGVDQELNMFTGVLCRCDAQLHRPTVIRNTEACLRPELGKESPDTLAGPLDTAFQLVRRSRNQSGYEQV